MIGWLSECAKKFFSSAPWISGKSDGATMQHKQTIPAKIFFETRDNTLSFLEIVVWNAHKAVDDSQARKDVLTGLFVADESARKEARDRTQDRLDVGMGGHIDFFCELVGCHSINAFLNYVIDILLLAFKANPDTLLPGGKRDESKKVDLSMLIEARKRGETLDDVLSSEAEKKALELAYMGIDGLNRFCTSRFDVPLFTNVEDEALAVNMIEERNILVHNRGTVNEKFLSNVRKYPKVVALGDTIILDRDRLFQILDLTERFVSDFDARMINKIGLPTA